MHGEIDSRGTHNSIKKIKDDIAKLETDLKLKEGQSKKLSESLPNKIENARMEENGGHYIDAGVKKWTLNPPPYHVNNSAPAYTFPNDYYGNVNPYYNPPDIHPYTPTVQQPAVFRQSYVSHGDHISVAFL